MILFRSGDDFDDLSIQIDRFNSNGQAVDMTGCQVEIVMRHATTFTVAEGLTVTVDQDHPYFYKPFAPKEATIDWETGVYNIVISVIDAAGIKDSSVDPCQINVLGRA